MRKIFFLTTLLMMLLATTAFAAEPETTPETEAAADEPYIYTSKDFQFTITCPIKPLAVVQNPWQETEKHGEMLVFANEGFEVLYGYIIQVDAFDNTDVPDFNKGSIAAIGDYLGKLKSDGGFADANIVQLTKTNKGVWAITAQKIDVYNQETGELEGEFVADKQYVYTFFRTPEGRCISIQLICANLKEKALVDVYRGSVASFIDDSKDGGKKSQKEKEKREKEKKKKEKKNKK